MAPKTTPRGIRNNNPLNIRISGQGWRGKIKDNTDGSFEQFESIEWGIRAAIVIVRTYIRQHHLNTPAAIIRRWAPAVENDTKKYIDFVIDRANLYRNEQISSNSKFQILRLLAAMAYYENGVEVPFEHFEKAWSMI